MGGGGGLKEVDRRDRVPRCCTLFSMCSYTTVTLVTLDLWLDN